MAAENFKVKKGLEVGTAITATSSGVNVTGIVTATQFVGDGSGLTGVTGSGSGVVIKDEGSAVGTAGTINFVGSGVAATLSLGTATITINSGGLSDVVADTTPQLGGNLDLNGKFVNGTGGANITGVVTATSFSGSGANLTGLPPEITINNNGTSKIITGSGTANTLNANVNLTFDGTTLDVKSGTGIVNTGQLKVGTAATIATNGNATFSGIVTAASFTGDGTGLTGVASTDNIQTGTPATFLSNVNIAGVTTLGGNSTFSSDGTFTTSAAIVVENAQPGISFNDTGANPDFIIQNRDGSFAIRDTTNAANRFLVDMSNGNITATGSLNVGTAATIFANGNVTAGIVTASSFVGDGSGLSGVGATEEDTAVSSTSATTVLSFAKASYRAAFIKLTITQGSNYQSGKYSLIHDGTTVTVVEENAIATNSTLGTFSGTISGDNVLFQVTMGSSSSATVTLVKDLITV